MNKSRDAFRTISEVAEWLDTPAHVLRFWESKFTQVKPIKRAGGRRYYRPSDMALLAGIKQLLHEDGMTIKGAQKVLREQGVKYVSSLSPLVAEGEEVEEDAPYIEVEAPVPEQTLLPFPTQPKPTPTPSEGDILPSADTESHAEPEPSESIDVSTEPDYIPDDVTDSSAMEPQELSPETSDPVETPETEHTVGDPQLAEDMAEADDEQPAQTDVASDGGPTLSSMPSFPEAGERAHEVETVSSTDASQEPTESSQTDAVLDEPEDFTDSSASAIENVADEQDLQSGDAQEAIEPTADVDPPMDIEGVASPEETEPNVAVEESAPIDATSADESLPVEDEGEVLSAQMRAERIMAEAYTPVPGPLARLSMISALSPEQAKNLREIVPKLRSAHDRLTAPTDR